MNYYRSLLDENEKAVYDIIVENLKNGQKKIKIPAIKDFYPVINAINLDCPEFYYVNMCEIKYTERKDSYVLYFSYYDYDIEGFERIKNNIIYNGRFFTKDFDKVRYIHTYLGNQVKYDLTHASKVVNYLSMEKSGKKSLIDIQSADSNAYGAIYEKSAVCSGIALAAVLLLRALGLDALVMHGITKFKSGIFDVGLNHAWVLVKINHNYYHLDITMDLYNEVINNVTYGFFNVNDAIMQKYYEYKSPYRALSLEDNYFYKRKLIAYNDRDLDDVFKRLDYTSNCVCFAYYGKLKVEDVARRFCDFYVTNKRKGIEVIPLHSFDYIYIKILD